MTRVHPVLLASLLIDSLGSGTAGPMVLLYFHRVADLPLAQVGLLASVAATTGLVIPLFAGSLADRFSPRALVVAGQLIQALGYILFLVARDPVPIFLAFVLSTAGLRVFWATFFSMLAGLPLVLSRERLFAMTGMTQAVGFGVGALIGGLLVAHGSVPLFQVALAFNVASYLVAAVLLLQVPMTLTVPAAVRQSGLRSLLHDRAFLGLIVVDVGFAICSDALMVGLPIAVKEGGIAHVAVLGPLLALNTLVIVTAQLFVADRLGGFSRVQALAAAGGLWCFWALAMAVLPVRSLIFSSVMLAVLVLVYCLAEMIHAPVAQALAADAAPAQHRGMYLAGFQYGFAIASVVVPGAFTALFAVGHAVPWLALAGLAAATAGGVAVVGRFLPAGAVRPVAV
ncbi:MFS transporter [Kineosporia mesophila]|uniref:MFS transporter n=1 Tax=Kineosporia mesophila TaxID=566012 RepID=A0ABP6Z9B1_9ACTN|nr:MFS transporter [Kineosporia mesophila]